MVLLSSYVTSTKITYSGHTVGLTANGGALNYGEDYR
jgi:hypothetical protein